MAEEGQKAAAHSTQGRSEEGNETWVQDPANDDSISVHESERSSGGAETAFRFVYLVAGGASLWVALVHGKEFCITSVGDGVDDAGGWGGPGGVVVVWLTVEGVAALLFLLVSLALWWARIDAACPGVCALWIMSMLHSGWLVAGTVLSLQSDGVPEECRNGAKGDPLPFWVMWAICVVWLVMVCLSACLTSIIGCHQLGIVRSAWKKAQKTLKSNRPRPPRDLESRAGRPHPPPPPAENESASRPSSDGTRLLGVGRS